MRIVHESRPLDILAVTTPDGTPAAKAREIHMLSKEQLSKGS
jgi:hypothetical protein